ADVWRVAKGWAVLMRRAGDVRGRPVFRVMVAPRPEAGAWRRLLELAGEMEARWLTGGELGGRQICLLEVDGEMEEGASGAWIRRLSEVAEELMILRRS
ncbi:MAG TPA: hypothetical protein PKE55_08650, partial [Kiritimatiellia bacterium]|nr:hypothetical protein [Kiritimatiellia bacterium]